MRRYKTENAMRSPYLPGGSPLDKLLNFLQAPKPNTPRARHIVEEFLEDYMEQSFDFLVEDRPIYNPGRHGHA